MYMNERAKVNIKVANGKCQAEGKEGRSFQARVVPNDTLRGDSLAEKLVQGDHFKSAAQARNAISNIEEFILAELKKGNRIDFPFASFYPRLSSALSERDVDPEEDGVSVLGAVKATHKLVKALRDSVTPVNPEAKNTDAPKLQNVLDFKTGEYNQISKGAEVHIGHMFITLDQPDERFILQTYSSNYSIDGEYVATAEVIFKDDGLIKIKFNNDIQPGKYTLVAETRAGKDVDCELKRLKRNVTVVEG